MMTAMISVGLSVLTVVLTRTFEIKVACFKLCFYLQWLREKVLKRVLKKWEKKELCKFCKLLSLRGSLPISLYNQVNWVTSCMNSSSIHCLCASFLGVETVFFCSAIKCLVVEQILLTVRMLVSSFIIMNVWFMTSVTDRQREGSGGFTVTSFYFFLFAAGLFKLIEFFNYILYSVIIFLVFFGHSGNLTQAAY